MPHQLEYIVKDALMLCDKGGAPAPFSPDTNQNIKISTALVSTEFDKVPLQHIPSFGACSVTGSTCSPAPIKWEDTYKVKVKGGETLLFRCSLPCSVGGKIEFLTSGQVPLPQEDLDALMEEYGEEEEEDEGWGWWDTAELIPVVGNVIGMVREGRKGNWGMFALNAAFLVVDVATLGAGSIVTTPLKGGIKAGTKALAKGAAKAGTKAGAKQLAKGAGKALGKAVAKRVDDIAKATMKLCVFACFPAGTKVAGEFGEVNIEDIKVGDKVWSYNPDTGEEGFKPVTNAEAKTAEATVLIKLADEEIETTAEHPFYTKSGWKEAAELSSEDELCTRDGHWHTIQDVSFAYTSKTVYNFEVADWHTYFVGTWQWLVHNAKVCVSTVTKNFKWGTYLRGLIGPPPSWMVNPHAHHIVFKQGRGAMRQALGESKAILEKHGIDWMKGAENLVWAPNKNHSAAAAEAVRDALVAADKAGGKPAVVKKLKELGEQFANDTIDTLF